MFRGSVKSTGYPLHSPVSPSLPRPCVTACHHISIGLYSCAVSLISPLDRGGWLTPRPGRFTPDNYLLHSGPQGRSEGVRKISPSSGFDPLLGSRFTNYAIPSSRTYLRSLQIKNPSVFGSRWNLNISILEGLRCEETCSWRLEVIC